MEGVHLLKEENFKVHAIAMYLWNIHYIDYLHYFAWSYCKSIT